MSYCLNKALLHVQVFLFTHLLFLITQNQPQRDQENEKEKVKKKKGEKRKEGGGVGGEGGGNNILFTSNFSFGQGCKKQSLHPWEMPLLQHIAKGKSYSHMRKKEQNNSWHNYTHTSVFLLFEFILGKFCHIIRHISGCYYTWIQSGENKERIHK